ncbi:hypothetical protein POM88_042845 [Heracleum sosnowskyi]|uniref:TFA2 Winged helix domain-containing protein n=1 Tax=Heracleum sosnowskyi TaxID=360622 RepID=A0AAD8HHF0_9APIA|nr:hypothetical protein POM88_042845 [Heracleum sosnowskyi]
MSAVSHESEDVGWEEVARKPKNRSVGNVGSQNSGAKVSGNPWTGAKGTSNAWPGTKQPVNAWAGKGSASTSSAPAGDYRRAAGRGWNQSSSKEYVNYYDQPAVIPPPLEKGWQWRSNPFQVEKVGNVPALNPADATDDKEEENYDDKSGDEEDFNTEDMAYPNNHRAIKHVNAWAGKGSTSTSSAPAGDYRRAAGRGWNQSSSKEYVNYYDQPAVIPPPLEKGWQWRSNPFQVEKVGNVPALNPADATDDKEEENYDDKSGDEEDFNTEDIYDSDEYDSDESQKSHETLKKSSLLKGFFETLDDLKVQEINEPDRQWHCPACHGGPGAIDWYRGLQPLMTHAKAHMLPIEKRDKALTAPKHDLKDKTQLLKLIQNFPEGIAVADLEDAYPSVDHDLKALKAAGKILVVSNFDSAEDIAYPYDDMGIKVDDDMKKLFRGIELPRDMIDIEKYLQKNEMKPATNTAQRRAQAQVQGISNKPEQKKKKHGISKRTELTNSHLPK